MEDVEECVVEVRICKVEGVPVGELAVGGELVPYFAEAEGVFLEGPDGVAGDVEGAWFLVEPLYLV